jgi:hypothetical protein
LSEGRHLHLERSPANHLAARKDKMIDQHPHCTTAIRLLPRPLTRITTSGSQLPRANKTSKTKSLTSGAGSHTYNITKHHHIEPPPRYRTKKHDTWPVYPWIGGHTAESIAPSLLELVRPATRLIRLKRIYNF